MSGVPVQAPVVKRRRSRKRVAAVIEETQPSEPVEPEPQVVLARSSALGPTSLDDSVEEGNDQSSNHLNTQSNNRSNESTSSSAITSPRPNKRARPNLYSPKVIVYKATSNDVPNYNGTVGLPADAKYLLERLPSVIWQHSILQFLSVPVIFQHMIPINKFFYKFSLPLLHRAVNRQYPGVCQAKGEFELKANGRRVINASSKIDNLDTDPFAPKGPSIPLSPFEIDWLITHANKERTAHEIRNDMEMDLNRPTISKTQANSQFCVTVNQLNIQRNSEEFQNHRNHRFRFNTIVKLMFERFGSVESMMDYQSGKQARPRRASRQPMFYRGGGGFGIHGPGCNCGMISDDNSDYEDEDMGFMPFLLGGLFGGGGIFGRRMLDMHSEDEE